MIIKKEGKRKERKERKMIIKKEGKCQKRKEKKMDDN